MQVDLEGKVALVTGASKGIGRAIAAGMAEAGASVMLSSRKLEQLEQAAAGIAGETAVFAANAGQIDAADACVAATIERFGRLDILVNNAATNPHYGATLDIEPSMFDKTFEVNLRGPLYWSRAAYQQAFAAQPGVIVNIASVGGLRAEYGLGVYNLTKAALIHLTRQLRQRARSHPCRRYRPRSREDRLRPGAGRQLRHPAGACDADPAARRARGHRQSGGVPGLREGVVDHG